MASDSEDVLRLQLLRTTVVARRAVVAARLLLGMVPEPAFPRRAELAGWLVRHEAELAQQESVIGGGEKPEALRTSGRKSGREADPLPVERPVSEPPPRRSDPLPVPPDRPLHNRFDDDDDDEESPKRRGADDRPPTEEAPPSPRPVAGRTPPPRREHNKSGGLPRAAAPTPKMRLGSALGKERSASVEVAPFGLSKPLPTPPRGGAGAGAGGHAAVLQRFPTRAFGIVVQPVFFLPSFALVEVVCRHPDFYVCRLPGGSGEGGGGGGGGAGYRVPHDRLALVQEGPQGVRCLYLVSSCWLT